MSEPVQQGAGEPLGAKNFRPFLEGQAGGHHEAVMLIGPADNLKEQFGPGSTPQEYSLPFFNFTTTTSGRFSPVSSSPASGQARIWICFPTP